MSGSKTIIIYYSWPNTSGNHAGMSYFVKEFKRAFPDPLKLIEMPQNIKSWNIKWQRLHFYFLLIWLKITLKKSDSILFMEYFSTMSGNQTGLAIRLRHWGIKNRFLGLVHLSGNNLLELYGTNDYLKEGAAAVNHIIVFGSSLAKFFGDLVYKDKVIITRHYVDTEYYKPSLRINSEKLQIIHLGSLKRNLSLLSEIVKICPEVDFHICQGKEDFSKYFSGLKNVKLYGYLREEELLNLMQSSNISLSVIDDTIGSNVITTSMACGLPQIISDVGSVRDYCSDENTIFCNTFQDYLNAISSLTTNPEKVEEMGKNARQRALEISLNESIKSFQSILLKN
jgi:glycosyltransferase involved in cell wall biosynthesis